jgi:hypothetical protein
MKKTIKEIGHYVDKHIGLRCQFCNNDIVLEYEEIKESIHKKCWLIVDSELIHDILIIISHRNEYPMQQYKLPC